MTAENTHQSISIIDSRYAMGSRPSLIIRKHHAQHGFEPCAKAKEKPDVIWLEYVTYLENGLSLDEMIYLADTLSQTYNDFTQGMNKTLNLVKEGNDFIEAYKSWFLKRDKKQMPFIMTNLLILIPSFYSYDSIISKTRADMMHCCEGGFKGLQGRLTLTENLGYYSVISPRIQLEESRKKYLDEIEEVREFFKSILTNTSNSF